jgi:hypothetical protein
MKNVINCKTTSSRGVRFGLIMLVERVAICKTTPSGTSRADTMRVDRPLKIESRIHTDYRRNLSVTDVVRERLETWHARSSTRPALACCKVAVDACFLSSRIYCAGSGTGPLTRPSSADGLSVPDRWHLTSRPRSAEGRLFVDHYLGRSLGSAIEAARRAGYPWTEQMSRKLSRKVRETRSSN